MVPSTGSSPRLLPSVCSLVGKGQEVSHVAKEGYLLRRRGGQKAERVSLSCICTFRPLKMGHKSSKGIISYTCKTSFQSAHLEEGKRIDTCQNWRE